MLTYASLKNDKMVEENKKQLLKIYFPEAKDPTETLLEEAKAKLAKDKNPVMRLGIESNKSISPETVNALLNRNK